MQVVALLAQKGGVGKTSIALALAVEASAEGRTVVVLDADPQASACKWRDRREADAPVVTDVQPLSCSHAVKPRARGRDLGGDTAARSETPPRGQGRDLVAIVPGGSPRPRASSACSCGSRRRSRCRRP